MATAPTHRVIGVQGVLEVYEDKVKITPKGCLAFLNFGFKGAKTIPYSSITAVEMKSGGLTNGYIQFTLPGGKESRGGITAAAKDENSFLFRRSSNKKIETIKEFIEARIGPQRQLPPPTPSAAPTASVADEIAKLVQLRDQGMLTEEEFAKAKAKLL